MRKNERHPSVYLSQNDVTVPRVFTIDCVVIEYLQTDEKREREKPVLYFLEKESKPLILNKTNDETLCAAFGDNDEGWKGKRVQLYVDSSIMFGGRKMGGIRIKPIANTPIAPRPASPPRREEEPPAPTYGDNIPF